MRETTLKEALEKVFGKGFHKKPNQADFAKSLYSNEINRMYKELDGFLPQYPTNYKGYDIPLMNFIVELDEERHFNRYRRFTLQSDIYKSFSLDVKVYEQYCELHEKDCLKAASWGKNWTTPSSEKQFGISSSPGDFRNNGSARWKQRAFYDYLRDASQLIINIPLIRVSIWEKIDNQTINGLIERQNIEPIISLINSKT
jgi:hypothetical protein